VGRNDALHLTISELFTELRRPSLPEPEVEPQIVFAVRESLPRPDFSIWPKSAALGSIRPFLHFFSLIPLKPTALDLQTRQSRIFPHFFVATSAERSVQLGAITVGAALFPTQTSNNSHSAGFLSHRPSLHILALSNFSSPASTSQQRL
jgi:hypothetical protein